MDIQCIEGAADKLHANGFFFSVAKNMLVGRLATQFFFLDYIYLLSNISDFSLLENILPLTFYQLYLLSINYT